MVRQSCCVVGRPVHPVQWNPGHLPPNPARQHHCSFQWTQGGGRDRGGRTVIFQTLCNHLSVSIQDPHRPSEAGGNEQLVDLVLNIAKAWFGFCEIRHLDSTGDYNGFLSLLGIAETLFTSPQQIWQSGGTTTPHRQQDNKCTTWRL